MRGSLDHCVKCTICETQCPFSNATPLFPGPKYVGPQAERYRVAGEPSPDASLDYCSGCGICTQVCPQGVHIAEINTQARAELKQRTGIPLRDRAARAPDARRPARDAGRAAGQLDAAQQAAARARREGARPAPRRARCRASPGARSRAGRSEHAQPAAAQRGRLLPRLRDQLLRAAAGGDDRRAARAQRLRGRGAQAGLLRAPAAVQRACSTTRARYVRRLASELAPYAREGVDIVSTSTSCCLMLKREAREILGMEDDPELRLVSDHIYDICEYLVGHARAGRAEDGLPAGARDGHLPRAVPAARPLHRQAGARPVRADSRAARRSSSTPPAAAWPGPTGSRRRSTRSR